MPNVDVQWPSEDEDFDAVSTPDFVNSTVSGASTDVHSRQTVAPRAVQVQAVQEDASDSDSPQPAADYPGPTNIPAPEAAVEAPQPVEEAQAVSEAAPASEPLPEPATVVEPQAAAKPAKAPKPPKAPRAKGSHAYVHYAFEAVLVIALIAVGYYAYNLQGDKKDLKTQVTELNANPQVAVQKQTQTLISSVGSLMQLPTNETPTIANVSDAAQAKQQSAFFNNAQNGDKVLMYVKAGEAILYRPSTNRIVLVAPLTFSNNAAAATSTTKK